MNSVVMRCFGAVLLALALQALGLLLLGSLFGGAAPELGLSLRLLCVLPLAALATHFVLGKLRADLGVLQKLAARELDSGARSALASARTHEALPLFESVALLYSRSTELESTEQEARNAVEAAERLRSSFVAAMAHDLRGPLNAITGFSDLLVMEKHDAVAPAQRASVEIIRRSAQDLLVLLDQVLDWAKLEAGIITLEKAPVELSDVLNQVSDEAKARSADRGLVVELDLEADLPRPMVDAARLKQALLGLCDHATRAPDHPRVRFSVRVRPDAQGNACVRIELHDPQLIVREADHAGFFEPFRPSYAPSGRRVAGLGLGPALGRALIRAHGGSVWFVSEAASGTTFTLELPLHAD